MIKTVIKLFNQHPRNVNETYWQHLRFSLSCGVCMVLAGFACLIHAIFPFIFKTTGSQTIKKLHQKMEGRIK